MELTANAKKAMERLSFRTAQVVEEPDETGKMKKKAVPVRRPMTEADVLAVKAVPGGVVLVSADGMKHRVSLGKNVEEPDPPAAAAQAGKNGGGKDPKGNGGPSKK